MWRTIAIAVTAVAATCGLLVSELLAARAEERKEQRGAKGDRRRAYERGMRERDYLPLIPAPELKSIKTLLERIYAARGWRDDPRDCQRTWAAVIACARQPGSGAWPLDFLPGDISEAQLQSLCDLVEQQFMGGLLEQRVAGVGRPALKVVWGRDPNSPLSWLSGLHENNTIYVNQDRWQESISESNPLNFEGTLCSSKLEVLAHTLGHEMVHALVLNYFPLMDRKSPAYTPDDKHGPIFMLISKRIFGHTSLDSKQLFTVD